MKTAIITGAAQNIGKGIAKTLLGQGYVCILIDNNSEQLKKTVNELGDNAKPYEADISDMAQLERFVDWLDKEGHEVSVLVNNAVYGSTKTLLELTSEEILKSNQTNLDGPFYLTTLVTKKWSDNRRPGNVIFISSTHGKVIRTYPLYSSAKASIEMFVKEAALELAALNIRVNAVAPGVVKDMPEAAVNDLIPTGVSQQPQDIGEAVAFLISDKARFITGQTLTVDGGFSLTHTHYFLKNNKL